LDSTAVVVGDDGLAGEGKFPLVRQALGCLHSLVAFHAEGMEQEQTQNFNERLSEWVSSQGFWFQLRYSMAGSGAKGTVAFHALRLAARLLVFLLILAVAGWVYLLQWTRGEDFRERVEASFSEAVGASGTKLRDVSRSGGELTISRIASIGEADSFFSLLEARGVTSRMGLLDGLRGNWDPGTITIGYLDLDLRLGIADPEAAARNTERLFGNHKGVVLSAFDIENANLRWGDENGAPGSIEGSALRMQKIKDSWRMQFVGGKFSQNWLRGMDIVNLVMVSEPGGFRMETAQFRLGQGTVDLSGVSLKGGPDAGLKGRALIRRLPLGKVLPEVAREFVEGTLSGDFQVSGWVGHREGIGLQGTVKLDGGDLIQIKDRIHVLRALSVVDSFNKYRTVDFQEGSFQMKTEAGRVSFSNVDLKAGDQMQMEGGMVLRPLSMAEREAQASQVPVLPIAGTGFGAPQPEAEAAQDLRSGSVGATEGSVFERVSQSIEWRRQREEQFELEARSFVYEGQFKLSLPPDVFERAEVLKAAHPVDPTTGRVPFVVPIQGTLFDLTQKQAEDIYTRRRR
jgi:hypothetical protein